MLAFADKKGLWVGWSYSLLAVKGSKKIKLKKIKKTIKDVQKSLTTRVGYVKI